MMCKSFGMLDLPVAMQCSTAVTRIAMFVETKYAVILCALAMQVLAAALSGRD